MNETRTGEIETCPRSASVADTTEDITVEPFQGRGADEGDEAFRARLDLWYSKFADKLQAWKQTSVVDKIVKLVALLQTIDDNRTIYDRMRREIGYPFQDSEAGSDPLSQDLCLHSGRVRLKNGRLVEWQIWNGEHSIDLRFW